MSTTTMNNELKPLLIRQQDLAKRMGVTDRTLRNWHKSQKLTMTKIGNVAGYRPEDVEAFLTAHRKVG